MKYLIVLQHPPDGTSKTASGSRKVLEYAGQLPRLTKQEKHFIAHLITGSRDVRFFFYMFNSIFLIFNNQVYNYNELSYIIIIIYSN